MSVLGKTLGAGIWLKIIDQVCFEASVMTVLFSITFRSHTSWKLSSAGL